MKNVFYLVFLIFSSIGFTQIHTGDLTLETQSEIDTFNYSEITGQLTITENSSGNITNLNGLTTLTTLGGGLLVKDNTALGTLNGLDNLISIGSSNYDVLGLNNVGLNIINNDVLTSISALENVTSIGSNINIRDNPSLVNLIGLEGITSLDANIFISNNMSLSSLNGLGNLTTVDGIGFYYGGIFIQNNSSLATLSALTNLTTIEGTLKISNNDALTNLNGLQSLTSITIIGTGLSIGNNENLTTLDGIDNLSTFSGGLSIFDNASLTSISALHNITAVTEDLNISSNGSLTTLNGLDNITSVGSLKIGNAITTGEQYVPGNTSLTTLSHLSNLTTIKNGVLVITGCDSLTSLDGLENINTLQQAYPNSPDNTLHIGYGIWNDPNNYVDNPQLSDFCGIQRLVTLGEITSYTDFVIENNAFNPTISDLQSLNCNLPPTSQTVFRWRTATDNGTSITETINGITATFTGDNASIVDIEDGACSGGGFDNMVTATISTSITFSFSEPVDVVSIMTSRGNTTANHTFTPVGGSNNVVNTSQAYSGTVDLNWEGITSFTVATDHSCFGFDELRVNHRSTLSTNEYEITDVRVFPNPTSGYLNIESEQRISTIEIYSLQGQKILSFNDATVIDVNHLNCGIYYMKVVDNLKKPQMIKFIRK